MHDANMSVEFELMSELSQRDEMPANVRAVTERWDAHDYMS